MALTSQQLAERRAGITATDIAAIAGMHPFRCALDVALDKRGIAPPEDLGPRVKWGNLLEAPIRADYAERHNVLVTVPGTLTHPRIAHHLSTPDGIVFYVGDVVADRGMEIKTHTVWVRGGYGEPGTDEVPLHELVQCGWNMHVTGLPRWDLVAFIDGLPTDYRIERDLELEQGLVEVADRFWRDVIIGGNDPDPDGSARYGEHLAKRWPRHVAAKVVTAEQSTVAAIAALKEVRDQLDAVAQNEAALEQAIKVAIGDAEAIEFPALVRGETERITYKLAADANVVAAGLADAVALVQSSPTLSALEVVLAAWPDIFRVEGGEHVVMARDLRALVAAIRGIATHATRPGGRRFVVPRSWSNKIAASKAGK